jgi:uncharacterized protein YhaN
MRLDAIGLANGRCSVCRVDQRMLCNWRAAAPAAWRRAVDDIMGLDHRIETMEANVSIFSSEVAKLADACGCADGSKTATELLGHLGASAGAALVAAQERSRLKHQEDDELEKEAAADRVLAQAHERLMPLLEIGNTRDKEILRGWLADADRRSSQRAALSALDIEIVSLGDGLDLTQLLDEVMEVDPDGLKIESIAIEDQLAELSRQIEEQMALLAAARRDFDSLTGGADAAVEASEMAFARAEMEVQAESYVRLRTEAIMLKWAIEKYRREKQAPLLARASALFSTLTLGTYTALLVGNDSDPARLCGLPAGAERLIPVDGMSEGTVDHLYLALRLAAVEDAVENGINLPFFADDLFINYDDKRAEAGFRVLAELSKKTQVLFFTHHQHLVALAQSAVPTIDASVCRLAA